MSVTRNQGVDETRRRDFEDAWFSGTPQPIARFLPPDDDDQYLPTLEELVHIDLEFRWKAFANSKSDSPGPLVEHYVNQFPRLRDREALRRLVQQEYWARSRFDTRPETVEYLRRFDQLFEDARQVRLCIGDDESAVNAGESLGRYELVRVHARGGFGEIWRAYDPILDREIAIKTLRSRFSQQEENCRRFVTEAQVTARLEHPGVVSVHDLGEPDSERPFFAMRMLNGETFAETIKQFHAGDTAASNRAVQRLRLLSAFLTVTRTVEFAHAQGVIHRDLKPHNVILGEFGETAILDWGLAKDLRSHQDSDPRQAELTPSGEHDVHDTRQGTVLGTPAYMSPEQALGRIDTIDERSDQYCLGVMLYELLTGQTPFPQGTPRTATHPQSPRSLDRGVPAALEAICLKAMAWNRDDRYVSVHQLTHDLERYMADEPVSAYTEPISVRAGRWIRRHRTLVSTAATTAAVAAVLLTAGVMLLWEANRNLARREREAKFLKGQANEALDKATQSLSTHRVGIASAELNKNNVGRAEQLLSKCPEGMRYWEWYYLQWLIDRHKPVLRLAEHRHPVSGIAFSADDRWMASCDREGHILVWDLRDGSIRHRMSHGLRTWGVAFGAGGRRLFSVGNDDVGNRRQGVIRLWDMDTGEQVNQRFAHGQSVICVAVADQGRLLATGGSDGTIRIRNPETLKPAVRIAAHDKAVRSVAFRPAPDRPQEWQLISGSDDGTIRVWDVATGDRIATLTGHQGSVLASQPIPDSPHVVTTGEDNLVRVWLDATSSDRDPPRVLTGHTDDVTCAATDPRGDLIVSGGMDRNLRLWNVADGKSRWIIRSHTSHVQSVAFSRGGDMFASGDDGGAVHLWHLDQFGGPLPQGDLVAFSPVDHRLAVGAHRNLQIWETDGGRIAATMPGQKFPMSSVRFSNHGHWVAASYLDGTARVWDASSGALIHELADHESRSLILVFSPDDRMLAVGHNDGDVRIYDPRSGELIQTIHTKRAIYRLAFDQPGEQLVVGHVKGQLGWWSLADPERPLRQIDAHDGFLLSLAFHPQGQQLATTGSDGIIRIWDHTTGRPIRQMTVGAAWVNCMSYTPDGHRLVSGSEHTVTFWDPNSGEEMLSMSVEKCVHEMSFSADGRFLSLAGEHPQIRIWQGGSFVPQPPDSLRADPRP